MRKSIFPTCISSVDPPFLRSRCSQGPEPWALLWASANAELWVSASLGPEHSSFKPICTHSRPVSQHHHLGQLSRDVDRSCELAIRITSIASPDPRWALASNAGLSSHSPSTTCNSWLNGLPSNLYLKVFWVESQAKLGCSSQWLVDGVMNGLSSAILQIRGVCILLSESVMLSPIGYWTEESW